MDQIEHWCSVPNRLRRMSIIASHQQPHWYSDEENTDCFPHLCALEWFIGYSTQTVLLHIWMSRCPKAAQELHNGTTLTLQKNVTMVKQPAQVFRSYFSCAAVFLSETDACCQWLDSAETQSQTNWANSLNRTQTHQWSPSAPLSSLCWFWLRIISSSSVLIIHHPVLQMIQPCFIYLNYP